MAWHLSWSHAAYPPSHLPHLSHLPRRPARRYIENVLEELDMEREWYYNASTHTLYYAPNATAAPSGTTADGATPEPPASKSAPKSASKDTTKDGPPPADGFVATGLEVLLNISGTQDAPAHGITITGLTLRDTSYTYFAPHGLPSGGDWGLQKQGAITLAGTEDVSISHSLFTALDGNAIFIGGYNRRLLISLGHVACHSLLTALGATWQVHGLRPA